MEPHRKGDFTEAVVLAELKRREVLVSVPFGDNERQDLVVEETENGGGCTACRCNGMGRGGLRRVSGVLDHPSIDWADEDVFGARWPPSRFTFTSLCEG